MDAQVNFLAVVLAGIVSMVVGFLWYSPVLFAKPWMKLMGYTTKSMKESQQEMGKLYLLSFVATLLTAFVLSHVMALSDNYYQYPKLMTGITTAFWMWIGFIAPTQMTEVIFGKKSWSLFAINTGYQLASVMAMSVILALL
ncbi:DUF1761 domain-containing protein [Patescibacteria group bacterium]|nr:DUF1761 domain-containing protein [Patescibacteria group bacterium]